MPPHEGNLSLRVQSTALKKAQFRGEAADRVLVSQNGIPEPSPTSSESKDATNRDPVLSEIEEALRGLRFGQVVVIVQDGVVVQIDRIERRRIHRRKPD